MLQGYEERRYPSVSYVCTEAEYEMGRHRGPGTDYHSSKLFKLLFKYISGNNRRRQKIEMTSPVISKMVVVGNRMKKEMCFYIPKKFQMNPPRPRFVRI